MADKMNLQVYREKLRNDGLREAIKYKNNFIPKVLYKYNPLLDDRYVNFKEENRKRLSSLKKNKLWVSHYTKFNDPFEFKIMTIDIERLKATNWKVEHIETYLNLFKDMCLVSCFSSNGNSMPMWAHYANNHKGYCVKYSVVNPESIFPVLYEPKRVKSLVIPTNIISEIYKGYEKNLPEPTKEFFEYFSYFYLSLTCKHDFWQYENEYRLLYLNSDLEEKRGKLVELREIGLKVDAIYIGYKCDIEYVSDLIEIGKALECEVYKMEFDEYTDNFSLITNKLT